MRLISFVPPWKKWNTRLWICVWRRFWLEPFTFLGFVVIIRKAGQLFPLNWISSVFKVRLLCWCRNISGSVQPPRVKTYDFFLRDLQRHWQRTYPFLSLALLFPLSPSILLFPPLSCVSNTFQLSHNNALTSNADGNAILLTCVLSAPLLLYPSLSLWASGLVSLLSTKQILFPLLLPKLHLTFWAWLKPGFVQKTQQPLLR